jgi:hypothetical protein
VTETVMPGTLERMIMMAKATGWVMSRIQRQLCIATFLLQRMEMRAR